MNETERLKEAIQHAINTLIVADTHDETGEGNWKTVLIDELVAALKGETTDV